MPNNCYNKLTVRGDKESLVKMRDFVRDTEEYPLSFEKVIPFPKPEWRENGATKETYTTHGYDWAVGAWGTKWNAYDFGERPDADSEPEKDWRGEYAYVYEFYTAWSPPKPVVAELAKKFPTLNFRLYSEESGMGFVCLSVFEDGEMKRDDHWDDLPEEMDLNGG